MFVLFWVGPGMECIAVLGWCRGGNKCTSGFILALLDCISLPGVWRLSLAENNTPSFDTPFNRTPHSTPPRFRSYDR